MPSEDGFHDMRSTRTTGKMCISPLSADVNALAEPTSEHLTHMLDKIF